MHQPVEHVDLAPRRGRFQQARIHRIVEIGAIVGHRIGRVDQLRFEQRPLVEQELGQFGILRRVVGSRMLHDALAHLERQVQPTKTRVAVLEVVHDAQRMQVVVERIAVAAHLAVEHFLAGVAERRVTEVVAQSQRLDQVFVQFERPGHGARNLRDLDGMRQAVTKMVGIGGSEHLRLVLEPAEGPRVHNAVAVALIDVAVGVSGLGKTPAATLFGRETKMRRHGEQRGRRLEQSQSNQTA